MSEGQLSRVWILRQFIHPLSVVDSMEFLLERMSQTKSNQDFLNSMSS